MERDHVDTIVEEWALERPELDTSAIAVVGRVLRVARYLERKIERCLSTFGLGISEFNVLAALGRAGSPYSRSPTQLSQALLLTSGGLTKLLDRLEAAGLIQREPDPTDRRGLLVRLSPDGKARLDEAMNAHLENEERLLADISPEDREDLKRVLRTMLVSFEDHEPRRSSGGSLMRPADRV